MIRSLILMINLLQLLWKGKENSRIHNGVLLIAQKAKTLQADKKWTIPKTLTCFTHTVDTSLDNLWQLLCLFLFLQKTLNNRLSAKFRMDEILKCDHSIESYWAVLSCGTVYFVVQGGSNLSVRGWNPKVWSFKWKLLRSTFLWCCLLCCTRWF